MFYTRGPLLFMRAATEKRPIRTGGNPKRISRCIHDTPLHDMNLTKWRGRYRDSLSTVYTHG